MSTVASESDRGFLKYVILMLFVFLVARAVGQEQEEDSPPSQTFLERLSDLASSLRAEPPEAPLDEPFQPSGELVYVDLSGKTTKKLSDGTITVDENTLDALSTGVQTLAGVKFQIIDGVMQLTSDGREHFPESVDDIPIQNRFSHLYLFHATQGGANPVPEGGRIGHYVVHYEDKTQATIPIVYGQDVRDWWNTDQSTKPGRAKVAWVGLNPGVRGYGFTLRLFVSKWDNPKPDTVVTSIDYVSEKLGDAAPFCIAMTLERAGAATPSAENE